MFETIGLIAKLGDPRVHATLQTLVDYLRSRGVRVLLQRASAAAFPGHALETVGDAELGRRCQLALAVGGDGTMLQAARTLMPYQVPLLGINLGRLGYLADLAPDALETHLGPILAGQYVEEQRFMLQAEVYRDGVCLGRSHALNDVVVHKWNMAHMFSFETRINQTFLSNQRADGLIVSTPTGSTAYALSGGGPIVHPALNVLVLVAICPHTLSNRPIVIDADSSVEVNLDPDQSIEAQMTCDGVLCQTLLPGDRILVRKHRSIRLLHPRHHDHYSVWRVKLNWGRTP